MGNEESVPAMAEDGEVEVQKLRKELKEIKKEKKEMTKKLEDSKKQKEEIKNLKKEKKRIKKKKLEDSERQRTDLEELLQIKTNPYQSSFNQHTEQMGQQCRLLEALQNQTERLHGYFREYEGMF